MNLPVADLQAPDSAAVTKPVKLTVSIAMATYNGEKFILEQLESIAHQTVLPDELVVSDDSSTDATLEIVRRFSDTVPFVVKIIDKPDRLGWRLNFIHAAKSCVSDIIFFCDQDDIWEPRKIEIMRQAFIDSDVLLAYHKAKLIDASGTAFDTLHHSDTSNPWQTPHGMLSAFRREILVRSDLIVETVDFSQPDTILGHDKWLPLLALVFGNIVAVNNELVRYRQHAYNLYGANQPTFGWLKNIRNRIKDRSCAFAVLRDVSRTNARIFNILKAEPTISDTWRQNASTGEIAFTELAGLYQLRSDVYNAPSMRRRLQSLISLARKGAYRGTAYWSFGRDGLKRDIIFGVILSKLVRRFSLGQSLGDANCRKLWLPARA